MKNFKSSKILKLLSTLFIILCFLMVFRLLCVCLCVCLCVFVCVCLCVCDHSEYYSHAMPQDILYILVRFYAILIIISQQSINLQILCHNDDPMSEESTFLYMLISILFSSPHYFLSHLHSGLFFVNSLICQKNCFQLLCSDLAELIF